MHSDCKIPVATVFSVSCVVLCRYSERQVQEKFKVKVLLLGEELKEAEEPQVLSSWEHENLPRSHTGVSKVGAASQVRKEMEVHQALKEVQALLIEARLAREEARQDLQRLRGVKGGAGQCLRPAEIPDNPSALPSVSQLPLSQLLTKSGSVTQDGGIGALLEICRAGSEGGKEQAVAALVNLALANDQNKQQIANKGGVGVATELCRSESAAVKERATILLAVLAYAEKKDVKLVGWMGGQRPTNSSIAYPRRLSTSTPSTPRSSATPVDEGMSHHMMSVPEDNWTSRSTFDDLSDAKSNEKRINELLLSTFL